MSKSLWTVLGLVATAVSSVGCSEDSNPSHNPPANDCATDTRAEPYSAGATFEGTNGVKISLMDSAPAPPALGNNTWTLDVKDSAGAAIADATIAAEQFMVDHGHPGAKAIGITSLGGGSYEAKPVNFNMSGYWETTFTVTSAGVESKVVVKLCIP